MNATDSFFQRDLTGIDQASIKAATDEGMGNSSTHQASAHYGDLLAFVDHLDCPSENASRPNDIAQAANTLDAGLNQVPWI